MDKGTRTTQQILLSLLRQLWRTIWAIAVGIVEGVPFVGIVLMVLYITRHPEMDGYGMAACYLVMVICGRWVFRILVGDVLRGLRRD